MTAPGAAAERHHMLMMRLTPYELASLRLKAMAIFFGSMERTGDADAREWTDLLVFRTLGLETPAALFPTRSAEELRP